MRPPAPSTVPGRRNEYGPTDEPAPSRAPCPWLRTTRASSPTSQSSSVVSGPTDPRARDARRAVQLRAGQQGDVGLEPDVRVDPGRLRVEDRDAGPHPALEGAVAE